MFSEQGASLSDADFKAKALPLHLNLTHTPPTISKEENMEEKDNEQAELEHATVAVTHDAGFIGNLTLVPTVFSTGSYGWKGNKRLTVELQNGDTDAEGGKEKVQIMLTYCHYPLPEQTDIHWAYIASMPPW